MNNTLKGPGEKGSKYWMQVLVNSDNREALTKEIQKKDSTYRKYNLDITIKRI